ncbi:hypothetical protein EGR_11074 [Echinococcus granulosus]|uniref:Uncharacterized protein n=1 Tax=Echinococcus granulosus TaxID=6210 RepID=W6U0U0_ECHGR|nr:hypothetical protein EGR_11074 [Echinococcus granulosus]EUB54066.1 hypothetical protein EGR_11074 [Echinococcus granulosus]
MQVTSLPNVSLLPHSHADSTGGFVPVLLSTHLQIHFDLLEMYIEPSFTSQVAIIVWLTLTADGACQIANLGDVRSDGFYEDIEWSNAREVHAFTCK